MPCVIYVYSRIVRLLSLTPNHPPQLPPPQPPPNRYAKVEKIAGGEIEECRVLSGVMFNKDITHPRMRRMIRNPRVVLLDCPLEYKKGESQTNVEMTKESDWEAMLKQEEEEVLLCWVFWAVNRSFLKRCWSRRRKRYYFVVGVIPLSVQVGGGRGIHSVAIPFHCFRLLISCFGLMQKQDLFSTVRVPPRVQVHIYPPNQPQVKKLCDEILRVKPDVVITEKGVSDLAQHFLLKKNVSCIRRIRKTDNNRIARCTGATIVNRAEELQESNVGTKCGLFEVQKIGEEYFTFMTECENPKACSVILRGASKDVLNEMEVFGYFEKAC